MGFFVLYVCVSGNNFQTGWNISIPGRAKLQLCCMLQLWRKNYALECIILTCYLVGMSISFFYIFHIFHIFLVNITPKSVNGKVVAIVKYSKQFSKQKMLGKMYCHSTEKITITDVITLFFFWGNEHGTYSYYCLKYVIYMNLTEKRLMLSFFV